MRIYGCQSGKIVYICIDSVFPFRPEIFNAEIAGIGQVAFYCRSCLYLVLSEIFDYCGRTGRGRPSVYVLVCPYAFIFGLEVDFVQIFCPVTDKKIS